MSASCSMAPDSRRSESMGRLLVRLSGPRESWDRQSTGTFSSFAMIFKEREISPTTTYISPSNEDGNRITLGEGGHGIVEIIDTYYGLNRISESTIDYIKGF